MRQLISTLFLLITFSCIANEFIVFEKDGYFGIKDNEGQVTVPAVYEGLGWSDGTTEVINGIIGFKRDNLWGLITARNKPLTDQKFYTIEPSALGYFKASIKGKFSNYLFHGILDEKGKTVVSFNYFSIEPIGANWLTSEFDGRKQRFGVVSFQNTIVIPNKYQSISESNGIYIARLTNRKLDMYQTSGKAIQLGLDSLNYEVGWIGYRDGFAGYFSNSGDLIHDFKYKAIKSESGTIVPVEFSQWSIYEGETHVMDHKCDSITYGDELFVAYLNGAHQLLVRNNQLLENNQFILKEVIEEMLVVQNSKSRKWSVIKDDGSLIFGSYDSIHYANTSFAALNSDGWKVVSSKGQVLNRLAFDAIKVGIKKQWIAKRNNHWGIFDSFRNTTTYKYDSVIKNERSYIVNYLNRWGLMDASESWIIRPEFNELISFGKYLVGRKGNSYTYILDGQKVFISTSKPYKASNGAMIIEGDSGFGMLNTVGELVAYPEWEEIESRGGFFELRKDGFSEALSSDGKVLLTKSLQFQSIMDFSEDYYLIKEENRWGFVDEEGRLRISNRYDSAGIFQEGIAPIKLRGKWGFIDKNEALKIQPHYDKVASFVDGRSIVQEGNLYGLIDKQGNEVLEVEWKSIFHEPTGNYIIQEKSGKMGLVGQNGSFILRPSYDDMKDYTNRVIVLKNGRWGMLNYAGEEIFKIIYKDLKIVDNFAMIKH